MLDLLAGAPLLTIFIVVALGTALGAVPFGPVRFGAAGALFVGLAVGALDPRLGEDLQLVQTLGLALFVYTVGLAAGNTFFRDLRRQLPLMGVGIAAAIVGAVTVAVLGGVLVGIHEIQRQCGTALASRMYFVGGCEELRSSMDDIVLVGE